MKKIFLSVALASTLFAGSTSCDKVLNKLEEQIQKTSKQKIQNPLKLEYLQAQKEEISKKCVDGKIDSDVLKQIKSDTKYDYETKKLEQDKQKIKDKSKKLEKKQEKLDKKYQDKKEKLNKKELKKAEKNAKKEAKEELKQIKKQDKANKQ